MKAAIYCRVSTEDQGTNGTSLDSQQEACLNKAKELGYGVPDELVFKESYTGLSLDRPLFNVLRHKAKDGEFEALIIYSPDRLSREGETILTLIKEFKLAGVKLVCVNNQFDDSLTGKFIAFVLGWASEFEAAQIKERTMRGKRTRAKEGRLPQGTGAGLYGYKLDKVNKKRVILESEAKVVTKAFNMIADGKGRFYVAKKLNEKGIPTKLRGKWHPLTIGRMITNPAYIGKTYFGKTKRNGNGLEIIPEDKWIMMPHATPAIITEDLFRRANKALLRSKELHRGRPQHDYLLTGYIKCGDCGDHLIGTCLNHKYRYYHCKATYPTSTRGAVCKARYISADKLEDIVWSKVKEVIEHPKMILAELKRRTESGNNGNKANKDIASLRRRLDSYENQEKRLIKLLRYGDINEDSVLEEIAKLKKDRQEDQAKLNQLSELKGHIVDSTRLEAQIHDFCKRVKKNLDSCDLQTKRLVLDALDIQVIATRDKVDIKASVPLKFNKLEKQFIKVGI